MKTLVILGMLVVLGVEVLALSLRQQQLAPCLTGAAMAFLLFGVLRLLRTSDAGSAPDREDLGDPADSLRHWMSGAETRIHWSESTRTEWDRHWRPILARRFEITTGHRRTKSPAAFNATGKMLFGADLWSWVDPDNISRTGGQQAGPGRTVLEEILQRLEQR